MRGEEDEKSWFYSLPFPTQRGLRASFPLLRITDSLTVPTLWFRPELMPSLSCSKFLVLHPIYPSDVDPELPVVCPHTSGFWFSLRFLFLWFSIWIFWMGNHSILGKLTTKPPFLTSMFPFHCSPCLPLCFPLTLFPPRMIDAIKKLIILIWVH